MNGTRPCSNSDMSKTSSGCRWSLTLDSTNSNNFLFIESTSIHRMTRDEARCGGNPCDYSPTPLRPTIKTVRAMCCSSELLSCFLGAPLGRLPGSLFPAQYQTFRRGWLVRLFVMQISRAIVFRLVPVHYR